MQTNPKKQCKRCQKYKSEIYSKMLCIVCDRIIKNKCTNCGTRSVKTGRRVCVRCVNKKRLIYWTENTSSKAKYNRNYIAKRRLQWKKKLLRLFGGACIDCGYSKHHAALDFDHIDPSIKLFNISKAFNHRPWKEILEEARQCVIRCANCHRIKTFDLKSADHIPMDILRMQMKRTCAG